MGFKVLAPSCNTGHCNILLQARPIAKLVEHNNRYTVVEETHPSYNWNDIDLYPARH